jgi:23S rRNA pseudouridine2605 synthase
MPEPSGPDPRRRAEPVQGERLQRTLARAGLGSRRSVEDLIRAGRVGVNGRVAQLGNRVEPESDVITLDGAPVATHPGLRYFALNKPRGTTTTLRDPHAIRSLAPLLPSGSRLFPVGRLDRDSEGLLILTNDGDLSNRLAHPRYGVEKEYLVEVEGVLSKEGIRALQQGVPLEDGVARALAVRGVHRAVGKSSLRIVLAEGRKREVRRMMASLGHPVRRLVRVRVGPVRLGRLAPGKSRPLMAEEVTELYRMTDLGSARPGAPRR